MPVEIELRSAAPPEAVAAAIRAHAGVWRESTVPLALARIGVLGVEVWERGGAFRLWLNRSSYAVTSHFMLAGTVAASGSGGSVVSASIRARWPAWSGIGMGALAAVVLGLGTTLPLAPAFVLWAVLSGVLVLMHRAFEAHFDRRDLGPAWLIERLEAAVAEAQHR